MICPLCTNTNLQALVRDGIEIDVCPQCHGIWLDHGELSRLKAAEPIAPSSAPIPADQYDPSAFGDQDDGVAEKSDDKRGDSKRGDNNRGGTKHRRKNKKPKKRKRPSWTRRLGDIVEDVIDELD